MHDEQTDAKHDQGEDASLHRFAGLFQVIQEKTCIAKPYGQETCKEQFALDGAKRPDLTDGSGRFHRLRVAVAI